MRPVSVEPSFFTGRTQLVLDFYVVGVAVLSILQQRHVPTKQSILFQMHIGFVEEESTSKPTEKIANRSLAPTPVFIFLVRSDQVGINICP